MLTFDQIMVRPVVLSKRDDQRAKLPTFVVVVVVAVPVFAAAAAVAVSVQMLVVVLNQDFKNQYIFHCVIE